MSIKLISRAIVKLQQLNEEEAVSLAESPACIRAKFAVKRQEFLATLPNDATREAVTKAVEVLGDVEGLVL